MANKSRTDLLNFLDYLANKGLMNRQTVAARKASANQVLGILDESEAADISQIDMGSVMDRFLHLQGAKYTPETLGVYKSRTKAAIDDFLRYQKDPLNFKPAVQTTLRRLERPKATPTNESSAGSESTSKSSIEPPPAAVNILPIPIRSDLTIKIQGLPFDLTAAEANKIANVIKAMASER